MIALTKGCKGPVNVFGFGVPEHGEMYAKLESKSSNNPDLGPAIAGTKCEANAGDDPGGVLNHHFMIEHLILRDLAAQGRINLY